MRIQIGNGIGYDPFFMDLSDGVVHCRTDEQFYAVKELFEREPPDFICMDYFKPERPGQKFKCEFLMLFYRGGELKGARITPKGKVIPLG